MPLSPIISIYAPDGKPIPGPVPVNDPAAGDLTGCFGEEFLHRVFTIKKDYFYSLLYGVDFVRKHDPVTFVKQIDKMSVPLMKYLTSGTFLQKVEIRWYHFDKKNNEEYFRMTLEHVRLEKIRYLIPDVKAAEFERYGHLEELQLVFQKITWLYPKGYLTYTDIWNEAYSEVDQKNFGGKKDETEELTETPMLDTLTIKFTSGKFTEPKEGFKFDAKAKVTFTYTASRKPDGKENKVYAKLYAVYNGKTEDLRQTNEGRLVSGDSWSTEFKLKKPEGLKSDSDTVEYYAEVENTFAGTFKGESATINATGPELQSMEWKSPEARRDEMVSLTASFSGSTDGEKATVEIFEFDQDGEHDLMETLQAEVTNGKLETEWKYVYQEDTDDILTEEEATKTGGKYNPPEYFFTVAIGEQMWGDKQESGLLQFKDWIEVELQDEDGNRLANEPFELHLPDGTTQKGTLDEKGFARVESVPPGPVEVVFENYPSITIKE